MFKVGDKVVAMDGAMDSLIGQTGTVIEVNTSGVRARVSFPNGVIRWFLFDWLTLKDGK